MRGTVIYAILLSAALGSAVKAKVVNVEISGTTSSSFPQAGGPYNITGFFSWNSTISGASSDDSDVPINDPGISDFSLAFTGGAFDHTFTDNTLVASGQTGSMDLSTGGIFTSIINQSICLEGTGGNGICDTPNPADVVSIATSTFDGQIFFAPNDTFEGTQLGGSSTYKVSVVPVPAALPLLATGLAGLAILRRHRRIS